MIEAPYRQTWRASNVDRLKAPRCTLGFAVVVRRFLLASNLMLLLPAPALAISEDDLLRPEVAFAISAEVASPERILVHWNIADGYYLYQHALKASTGSPGYRLGALELPPGKEKDDEFFGKVVTYRERLTLELPVTRRPDDAGDLTVTLRSQGCADLGVCYPPLDQVVSLRLPARFATAAPAATEVATCSTDCWPAHFDW